MKPQNYAGPNEVRCDACTPRRIKAIKSCLTCVSSYCDKHLEQHNELHMGKKHQLIDAADLQSKTCSHHGKLLEYFCCTDQQCICVLCVIGEHKGHDTISAADERAEKQVKLVKTYMKFQRKIQDKEKYFKELMKAEESVKHSAHTTVTESERIFAEVVSSFERTCSLIKELITDQERAWLTHIEGLQEMALQEIDDMRMKVPELDQLMSTEDHIYFHQNYPSFCEEPRSEDAAELYRISSNPNIFFRNVRKLVIDMQNHLKDVRKKAANKILSATPKFSFGSGCVYHFTKKEGQWNCDSCLYRNYSSVTRCVSCKSPQRSVHNKSPLQSELADMFGEKDRQCDCSTCLKNKGTSSSCVSCQKTNPNMKRKTSIVSSPLFAPSIGSPANQSASTGFKASFCSDPMFEKDLRKDQISPESFKIWSSTSGMDKMSGNYFSEQAVFSHTAKIHCYDNELSEWKERGVGDIKIIQNYETKRARLVMKWDQVLKFCANHWITSNMKLEPMKGAENAWIWCAFDSAEGEGNVEQLAVRFKLKETANSFKEIFEKAKHAQDKCTSSLIVPPVTTSSEKENTQDKHDSDIEILFERKPTKKQAALATKLMLPLTFFCYKNEPGYISDDDDDDDDGNFPWVDAREYQNRDTESRR